MRDLQRMLPYTISEGRDGGVDINAFYYDRKYMPEEVSAEVLKFLKKAAEERCQRPVTEAVITVPAYF